MKLLDPRGGLRHAKLALAPRASHEALAAAGVLLYDNTKLDVGPFRGVLARIESGLRAHSVRRFERHRETIRGKDEAAIAMLAETLARSAAGLRGVVVALADMGVSPAMVTLAIELERRGMPTVCITAGPGAALAKAHAFYRAGSLCLCDLDIYPGSGADQVDREVDAAIPAILEMLTTDGAALEELSRIDYALDRTSVSSDGMLDIVADDGNLEAIFERFEALHIGDGLPFVPPTRARLGAMQRYCREQPDTPILAGVGPSGTPLLVRDALVACVMAGCNAQHVPVVLAALRAMAQPQYNLLQAITTSFGGGHFILVSGPFAAEAGVHSGQGCLGPGFRANATIGRAVSLALSNVCRSVPGFADLACLSSPAEYAYCMAEGAPPAGWMRIHEERFTAGDTCVMVLEAEAPHAIMDLASTNAESLMETVVDCCTTLGSNNAYIPGALVLILNPDHARLLHEGGYDKARVRSAVHARAKIERSRLHGRGLVGVAHGDTGDHFVTRSPKDVEVVVAGGRGGHSAVLLPWALHSEPVFERVTVS